MGIAIKRRLFEPDVVVRALPLGLKRKRGQPSVVQAALVHDWLLIVFVIFVHYFFGLVRW